MAAVDGGLNSDLVSWFEASDAFADRFDGAAELMADGDGYFLLGDWVSACW